MQTVTTIGSKVNMGSGGNGTAGKVVRFPRFSQRHMHS
jgi:hypothetical protein